MIDYLTITLLFTCILLGVTFNPIFMLFALFPFGYLVNREYEKRLEYKKEIEDEHVLDNLKDPRE